MKTLLIIMSLCAAVFPARSRLDTVYVKQIIDTLRMSGKVLYCSGTGRLDTTGVEYDTVAHRLKGVIDSSGYADSSKKAVKINVYGEGATGDSILVMQQDSTVKYRSKAGMTWTTGDITDMEDSLNARMPITPNVDIVPKTDNTYYIGKNDDDTPAAFKGLILKDQTDGKYYRIELNSGAVSIVDLSD